MKIAVFDIGTNTIHMLVVQVHPDGSYQVIGHEKDNTRIGDGSFKDHFLSKEKMSKALKVIKRFYKEAKKHNVSQMVGVATSAVREAQNGPELVYQIFKKTKIKVRIVSGEEEGRLIFCASHSKRDIQKGRVLTIDIGGGSMELILGDKKGISFNRSFPLGAARMTDIFLRHNPPTKTEIRKLEKHIADEVGTAAAKIKRKGFKTVIGTAGTIVNLAYAVYFHAEKRPLDSANHYEMFLEDIDAVYAKLIKLPLKKRLKFPELDKKRADIILAGCILLRFLMRKMQIKSITVSTQGIREGMVEDFIAKNRARIKVW